MTTDTSHPEKLRVIIAGGGVAAIETALALHKLAPEYTDVTVIAPNTEFVYRSPTATPTVTRSRRSSEMPAPSC